MEITVKKTVEEKKSIELPLFFKEPSISHTHLVAILSEADARTVVVLSNDTWVQQYRTKSEVKNRTERWIAEWTPITEEEFKEVWEAALQSLSLTNKTV